MTFRQQIEKAPTYDYQLHLENLDKQEIVNSYEEQLQISHELKNENKKLKEMIERLELSILTQGIKMPYFLHHNLDKIKKDIR